MENRRARLDQLWRERIHTDPAALESAPLAVRESFQSIWDPALRLRGHLSALPSRLLELWLAQPRGHLLITPTLSQYEAGLHLWRGKALEGVCRISTIDLAQNLESALGAVADLIDHLLGSGLEPGGAWLADGSGLTPRLQDLAARVQRLHALGYATPEGEIETPRSYMRRTLALYLIDAPALNALDPLTWRFYRHSLLSETWWRQS